MTRRLKIRVTTKPKSGAADTPEALSAALTDLLLGRTNQVPTLYIPRRTTQS
jgi:hypothetical protein